ncbi:HYR domain-containing protein [Flavobacteriaceae bacterium GSB9]|nr:HYR domain-containing protein [Flavobacteriaceae bacterium GSB9]
MKKYIQLFIWCVALLVTHINQAQQPTVPAGYSINQLAQGGLLANQELNGIVADPVNGDVYVATVATISTFSNFNLYKISPFGVVSLLGNYPFQGYSLVQMRWGPDNQIYTLNGYNVMKINPQNGTTSIYSTNSPVHSRSRYDLDFDANGNLIVSREPITTFYRITPPSGSVFLGNTAGLINGNHGDAFGIQPNGNIAVYVDCGGQNNYTLNASGHIDGTPFNVAWVSPTNVFSSLLTGSCAYSNGAIDPATGDIYSTILRKNGTRQNRILYTNANGGSSTLFVDNASGVTDLAFGPSTNIAGCQSLFFLDTTLNAVFEVPMNNCCNLTSVTATTTDANCSDTDDGRAEITINFSDSPVAIEGSLDGTNWISLPLPQSNPFVLPIENLQAGNYTVKVREVDNPDCEESVEFTVDVNPNSVDADGDGFTVCDGDCDDGDPNINPDAEEICDGIDNDCDGEVDESGGELWFADNDGDGFGDANDPGTASCYQLPNTVENNDDCNDGNNAIHPFAEEVCDGVDNNCDGTTDEGFDQDGDGVTLCAGDCDDTNASIYPGAPEISCDGVDNDCNPATPDNQNPVTVNFEVTDVTYGPVTPLEFGVDFIEGTDFTFASSGSNPGEPGGKTYIYTNLSPTNYGGLWFTFNNIENPRHSSQQPTGSMSFHSYDATTGVATFYSTAPLTWTNPANGQLQSINTQFRFQVQPAGATGPSPMGAATVGSIPANIVDGGEAGVPGLSLDYSTLDVKQQGDFQVWFAFEVQGTNEPLTQFYNNASTPPNTSFFTSVYSSFYSAEDVCSTPGNELTLTAVADANNATPFIYTFNGITNTSGIFPGIAAGTFDYSVRSANDCITTGTHTVGAPDLGLLVPIPDVANLPDVEAECEVKQITAPTATDACGVQYVGVADMVLPITSQGITEITWTYTFNGGTVTQTQNVIINDVTPPTIVCTPMNVDNDEGLCEAYVEVVPPSVSDNCNIGSTALDFDGSNDYISVSNYPHLTNFTLEAWVNPTYIHSEGYRSIISKGSVFGTNYNFDFGLRNNWRNNKYTLYFYLHNGSSLGGYAIEIVDTPNTWTHVAASFDDNTNEVILYQNGQELGRSILPVGPGNGVSELRLGHPYSTAGQGEPYTGQIDEVRIWNRTLSGNEILSGYNKILTGSESGLSSYYNFEDGVGSTTLADGTTNSYTGTLTNMDPATDWVASSASISPVSLTNSITGTGDASGIFPVGETEITWTATDANGNNNTCIQTITVEDKEAPIAIAQDITLELDENGQALITAEQVNNGSTDNCEIQSISINKNSFSCEDIEAESNNYALDFDGVDDYVDLPNPITLPEQFSIEAMVKINSQTGQFQILSNCDDPNSSCGGGDYKGIWFRVINGAINITTSPSAIQTRGIIYTATTQLNINEWYHVAAVVNTSSNSAKIYYNGVEQSTTNQLFGSGGFSSSHTPYIGAQYANYDSAISSFFNGQLDDIRVWNYVITPADIQNRMNIGLLGNETGLIAYYNLNEGENIVAQDKSINVNNGTLTNMDPSSDWVTGVPGLGNAGSQVTLTVNDIHGNSSTATANIIVEDNLAPEVVGQNIEVTLTASGTVSIISDDVLVSGSDNCGPVTYSISQDTFGAQDALNSPVTIELIGTDPSGNETSVPVEVTVIDPVPNALCQSITVYLDENGTVSIAPEDIDAGSNSVVGIGSLSLDNDTFTCENIGENTVVLTVTSTLGAQASCEAMVTVKDEAPPIVLTKNIDVYLDANGAASIVPTDVDDGSTDNCSIADYALDIDSFDCSDIANNPIVVTLTVTDVNGNSDSATANVTVHDDVKPIVVTQDIDVYLDANGQAGIVPLDVDDGSTDNCGIAGYALDIDSFGCGDIANNPIVVTLTVIDVNGNSDSAPANVTVHDDVKPTVITKNIDVYLDANGAANIVPTDADDGSTDNCSIASYALDIDSFDCSDIANNPIVVTLTVTDVNGNSDSALANVTVHDDVKPTVITKNIDVYLDANGQAGIVPTDVDDGSIDNCGIASYALDIDSFDCADITNNPIVVTLMVTDVNGNSDSAPANVTVHDNILPIALTQDIIVQLDNNGLGIATPEAVDNGSKDNCGIQNLSLSQTQFDCNSIGANEVELTVTDVNGNIATENAIITVEDNVAPNTLCISSGGGVVKAAYVRAQAREPWFSNTNPEHMDAVFGAGNWDLLFYETVNPNTLLNGDYNFIYMEGGDSNALEMKTFVDANITTMEQYVSDGNVLFLNAAPNEGGNMNWGFGGVVLKYPNYISTVKVVDNHPVLSNPTVVGQNYSGNFFSHSIICPATLSASLIIHDANDLSRHTLVEASYGQGHVLFGGMTTTNFHSPQPDATNLRRNILYYASGKINTNLVVQLPASGVLNIGPDLIDAGSTDACGILKREVFPSELSCSDVGEKEITLVVTDVNGNSSSCNSTISVIDNIPPIALCKNATVQLDALGLGSITTADIDNGSNDACGIKNLTLDTTDFTCADIGDNMVTLTVEDNNGNTSTCTATVTVIDNIKPIVMTQNIDVYLDANGQASIVPTDVDDGSTDNCVIASYALDIDSFDCSDIANNPIVVTLTVTDVNGNSDSAPANVTVHDEVKPTVITKNIDVYLDANGVASIVPTDVDDGSTDNCALADYALDIDSFSCSDIANNPIVITLTVTDVNGNSDSAPANVTVHDEVKPTVITKNIDVYLDANGVASIVPTDVDDGSTDNCGIADYALDIDSFDCSDIANNPIVVTLTVTDVNGNSDSAPANVTVHDDVKPIVITKNIDVYLDANGAASIVPTDVDDGSTDNCSIADYALDIDSFDCSDIANNPIVVTLTVTDFNGNSDSKTANVTVHDDVKPIITCVLNQERYVDPYQTYYTIDGTEFNATANDNCGINTITYVGGSPSTYGTTMDGVQLDLGSNVMTWTALDVNGNSSTCTTTVLVKKRPTTLIYTGDLDEQYSDSVDLSATLTDDVSNIGVAGKTIKFIIGSQSTTATTNANGIASTTLILTQNPDNIYTVETEFLEDASYLGSTDSDAFDITQENSNVNYIGNEITATQSTTNLTAILDLRVSIQDILDAHRGDIQNATVSFVLDGTIIMAATPISQLVDSHTGIISMAHTVELSKQSTSETYTLEILVDGYYIGSDQTVITVYVPEGDFITGGGHIIPTSSAGTYPSTLGTKTNFGFNVKFNKRGTKLQGKLNFIWRSGGRVYQAKSNATDALGIDIQSEDLMYAVFTSKCNYRDITDPLNPISLGGNKIMHVKMTDKGEPGDNDEISFALWDGNELLYASNWTGVNTIKQVLNGGNLVVHSGFSLGDASGGIAKQETVELLDNEEFTIEGIVVKSWPNPSDAHFNLKVNSSNLIDNVQINVFDVTNKLVHVGSLLINETYYFGEDLEAGTYVVWLKQGDKVQQVRLVKY